MQLTDGYTPEFIVYEVDGCLFVIGDENRVDVQLLGKQLHPKSALWAPLKLFTLNRGLVEVPCPDEDRMVFVASHIRRDGLELPPVFSLEGEHSSAIRAVRDWCERIILLAAHG